MGLKILVGQCVIFLPLEEGDIYFFILILLQACCW